MSTGCARVWAALALLGAGLGCGEEAANLPPEFSPLPAEVKVTVGDAVDLTVAATDPDGDAVSLSLGAAPEGAEFITPGGLGRFHWAPLASDAASGGQTHEVVFVADDGKGGRATLRVVVEVEPADGAPRFVTSPQRILDLSKTDTLEAEVAVKDDDSATVEMSLEGAPKGMSLDQTDPKRAILRWTPTPDQIAERPVWGATILADDRSSGPVAQTLSVTLLSRKGCGDEGFTCGCNPPTLSHEALEDQRGVEDYEVSVQVSDDQSAIQEVTLFWTLDDPADRSNFQAVPMEGGRGAYLATIPNPRLPEDKSAPIFYFLCARDDDDGSGDACDSAGCLPAQGAFSFTSFAPGSEEACRQDEQEPNDDAPSARRLDGGSAQYVGLTLCEGDKDLFAVELSPGQRVTAKVTHVASRGNVDVRILDSELEEELARAVTDSDVEEVSFTATEAGFYFVEVTGEPNNYELDLSRSGGMAGEACQDELEPNDEPDRASPLGDGDSFEALGICQGDADLYRLELSAGDRLDVEIFFETALGDLDMYLFFGADSDAPIARSDTVTDDERITHTASESGTYYLIVLGYLETDSNLYRLRATVEGGGGGGECVADDAEPNENVDEAPFVEADLYAGLTLCANERDWYGVRLDAGDRLNAEIAFETSGGVDLDFFLYGRDGREELGVSNGTGETEQLALTAPATGTYYLQVLGYDGSQTSYDLLVDVCDNDAQDPNDDLDGAAPLEAGELGGLVLCPGEVDFYRFSVPDGGVGGVDLTSPGLAELELILYASDGTTVLDRGASANNRRTVIFAPEGDTEAFVKVVRATPSAASEDYALTVEIIP